MIPRLNEKELTKNIITSLTLSIEKGGFLKYKNKQFIKVNEEVLQFIKIYTKKNDWYLWYAVFPLCEYNIWLDSSAIAGRLPLKEGELQSSNLEIISKSFENSLKEIFEFFKKRNSVLSIESMISEDDNLYRKLIKGICLAALDKPNQAKLYLDIFYNSGVGLGDDQDGTEKLLAAISKGTHLKALDNNKNQNIKKLRLKIYLQRGGTHG